VVLTPKELRRALGEALEHSWRPGRPTNTRGRWAGAAADGICRARQVSDPFRSVARFRSHLRGPRMPVMACRPLLAVAGVAPTATDIWDAQNSPPLCNTPGVGHQRSWYCSAFTPVSRKGLGRLPIHDKSAQRVSWVDRAHHWEADSEVGHLSNEYWLHGPSRNRRQVREVELDREYVVRCVAEIRHVGSPARAARCRPGEGERLERRRHPLTRRD
jgi:hypothetical protein